MSALDPRLPYIVARSPDGSSRTVQLTGEPVTVGRLREYNTIELSPDPEHLVSRVNHCRLDVRGGLWYVVPGDGQNPTFIERGDIRTIVAGATALDDGDALLILARRPSEAGKPEQYWRLEFHDPQRTQPALTTGVPAFLEYDTVGGRVFRVIRGVTEEVTGLRPQEHHLVRYMDAANAEHGYAAALCSHDDIAEALWGDEAFNHSETEIARIVWGLRRKIEPDVGEPQLLQTVRGLGYRLRTRLYSGRG